MGAGCMLSLLHIVLYIVYSRMTPNGKLCRCGYFLLEFYRVAAKLFSWELALPAQETFLKPLCISVCFKSQENWGFKHGTVVDV
jgi:hypothetical protein